MTALSNLVAIRHEWRQPILMWRQKHSYNYLFQEEKPNFIQDLTHVATPKPLWPQMWRQDKFRWIALIDEMILINQKLGLRQSKSIFHEAKCFFKFNYFH
jgi:hypothetical protein